MPVLRNTYGFDCQFEEVFAISVAVSRDAKLCVFLCFYKKLNWASMLKWELYATSEHL